MKSTKALVPFLLADVLFFCLLNPSNSNSFVIIIGCILLALTLYVMSRALFIVLNGAINIPLVAQKRLALSITISLTFLLLMQSVGQLGTRDVLAVIPLAVVSYFYLSYTHKKARAGSRPNETRG